MVPRSGYPDAVEIKNIDQMQVGSTGKTMIRPIDEHCISHQKRKRHMKDSNCLGVLRYYTITILAVAIYMGVVTVERQTLCQALCTRVTH